MPNLDGTDKPGYTPYDAHEQVARVPHEAAPLEPGYAHSGLVATDPNAPPKEFPKAVDVQENQNEPVVVDNHVEERDFLVNKIYTLQALLSAANAEIDYLKAEVDAAQKEKTALEAANAAAEKAAQAEANAVPPATPDPTKGAN